MTSPIDTENRAGIARITCGWKKPGLPLEFVRQYWRDVHSPAIARRSGIWEYHHSQFDAVDPHAFGAVDGIRTGCQQDEQLMWLSDVRYEDEQALEAFGRSPGDAVKAHLLKDIDLLVDKSSTYKCVGEECRTYRDDSGDPLPQGKPARAAFGVFFRQRGDADAFRVVVRALAERWSTAPGVLRLRANLLQSPDVEAERRGGYPIKTHPPELQYQAWFELVLSEAPAMRGMLGKTQDLDPAEHLRDVHAYPVAAKYCFNYAGQPTLVGLRGFGAFESISRFHADHQAEPALIEWMYGRPGGTADLRGHP